MYAKIFQQIFDSSLAEDYQTRHVFMDLLVLADRAGIVDMTYRAIAGRTGVPMRVVRKAIAKLCEPDPQSRSKEHEGRRIVPIDAERDWGWQIVNFQSYHSFENLDAKREYFRVYRQQERAAKKACSSPFKSVQHIDIDVHTDKDTDKGTETDSAEPKKESATAPPVPPELAGLELYEKDAKLLKAWPVLYPNLVKGHAGIDVLAQVRLAHTWEIANPKKRKKDRGRFLNTWMGIAQDRAGRYQPSQQPPDDGVLTVDDIRAMKEKRNAGN